MFCIHLEVGVHHFSLVPVFQSVYVQQKAKGSLYKFNGDLLVIEEVRALENDTK